MAVKFLTGLNIIGNVNLNESQLQNFIVQPLGVDPTGIAGRVYYNSGINVLKLYNGTAWVAIDGTVTSVAATHAGDAFTASIGNVATVNPSVDITMNGASTDYINGLGDLTVFPAIPQGDITNVSVTAPITGGGTSGDITIGHAAQADTASANAATLTFGGTFNAYTDVTTNATGHVTGHEVTTFTLPSNPNTNTTYTLPVSAGAANSAVVTLDASSGADSTVTFNGTTNEVQISESVGNNGSITIGLPDDVTITTDLTVGGSVGIGGDTQVNRKLKVHGHTLVDGNMYVSGAANTYSVEVGQSRTTEGTAFLDLTGEVTPDDYGLRMIRYGGLNAESKIIHTGTANLTINAENGADTIFTNTNVGIGTDSANFKLDVNGSMHSTNITIADYIYHELDSDTYMGFPFINTIYWVTSGSERMRISSIGNVGIGTTGNPGARLNVIGTGNIGGSDLANSYMLAGTTTKGIGIDPNEIASKGGVLQIGTLDNKDVIIKANGTEAIRVDSVTSNVGIGTTNPSYNLDVRGDESFIENVLTVGDIPDPTTDPTPNGNRVRVIGNSNGSANPGFITIDKNTNGSGETKGALLASNDEVKIGSITSDPVSIVVNNTEVININSQFTRFKQKAEFENKILINSTGGDIVGEVKSREGSFTIDATGGDQSVRLAVLGENKLSVLQDGSVTIASIGQDDNKPLLTVNGGVKIGNSYQSGTGPGVDDVGTMRYREGANASYLEMVMKTGATSYSWVVIKQNNY